MEYVQERITTLHDLSGVPPTAPTDEAAVVVPMTEREYAGLAAEHTLESLESVDPGRVVVALRASPDRVGDIRRWLTSFDLALEVVWCTGEAVRDLLATHGLDGSAGKGRDVWLGLGVAATNHPYVVCHDADARSFSPEHVNRLLSPVEHGFRFSKGYYARVEGGQLYGRLFRLLYVPLVQALRDREEAPILRYLAAFRYALAGEFCATADLARRLGAERRWGLEVGTLGDAFDHAGFEHTAQVDLGTHEHEHRAVGGPTGLADMSGDVTTALLRVVEEHGIEPDYEALPAAYRETAHRFVEQYAADAAFNGLSYDAGDERTQVARYLESIRPPPSDDRLPAWIETELDPATVLDASESALDEA